MLLRHSLFGVVKGVMQQLSFLSRKKMVQTFTFVAVVVKGMKYRISLKMKKKRNENTL